MTNDIVSWMKQNFPDGQPIPPHPLVPIYIHKNQRSISIKAIYVLWFMRQGAKLYSCYKIGDSSGKRYYRLVGPKKAIVVQESAIRALVNHETIRCIPWSGWMEYRLVEGK